MQMRNYGRILTRAWPSKKQRFAWTFCGVVLSTGCAKNGGSKSEGFVPERDPTQRIYSGLQPGKPCPSRRDSECSPNAIFHCIDFADGAPPTCDCPVTTEYVFATQSCNELKLGDRPGDACGPSGEGDIPYAKCDQNRGLFCKVPNPTEVDAVANCQCAEGQQYSFRLRACVGARLGEQAGEPCNSESSDVAVRGTCNAQRGLFCDTNGVELAGKRPICNCEKPYVWSVAGRRCVKEAAQCDTRNKD
jgi:hypothetical protein